MFHRHARIIVARANYIISHEIKNKKAQNLWVAFNFLCGNYTTLLYKKELTNNGLDCYFKVFPQDWIGVQSNWDCFEGRILIQFPAHLRKSQ